MAITQVKTLGIADDAVTEAKVANDAIGLPEMKAGTDGEIITYDASGNPAAVGAGSSGQVLTSRGAGTTATFQALPASNNYVHPNHSGEVTSTADGATVIASDIVDEDNLKISNAGSDGQFLSKQSGDTGGLTWATVTSQDTLSFRNLIVNGSMDVAQYATTSTSGGYQTVDRWQVNDNNTNVTITQSQHDLTSSDTGVWELGFRHSYHVALSAAGNSLDGSSYARLKYVVEAQDAAVSGWNHISASSYITLSFWFKCSTNQTFHGKLHSGDGTEQSYPFSFTASGNDTWTKITKTIPGHANVQIDNDAGYGLGLYISLHHGSDHTGSPTLNTWAAHSASSQYPTDASTWLTAGASTFEITGVQLEVGSTATAFEFRKYGQEYERCRRYFMKGGGWPMFADRTTDAHNCGRVGLYWFPVVMRDAPTMTDLAMTVYSGSAQTLGTNTITKEWVWFNHTGSFSDGREWCLINSFTASAEL